MSVFQKERHNRSYVYFQIYENGKRSVTYLGPGDDISTWEKAQKLFLQYQQERLNEFYSKIPIEFRGAIGAQEERRRQEAQVALASAGETEIMLGPASLAPASKKPKSADEK
jgi:hypothetical protein